MMAERYPILVAHLDASRALKLACDSCDAVWSATDPDAFIEQIETGRCPSCQHWAVFPAYEVGDACKNCGKLDERVPLKGCCSRACLLQFEYTESLHRRGAA